MIRSQSQFVHSRLMGQWRVLGLLLLWQVSVCAFLFPLSTPYRTSTSTTSSTTRTTTVLEAKKGLADAKAAALAALEEMEKAMAPPPMDIMPEVVKEEKKKEKKKDKKKEAVAVAPPQAGAGGGVKAAKAASLAALDAWDDDEEVKVDKKQKKKDKKEEDKKDKKKKKGGGEPEEGQGAGVVEVEKKVEEIVAVAAAPEPVPVAAPAAPVELTLEEKVRGSRPPPRVKIGMEDLPPGTVSLRLQDVTVIFRNQEVLRGVTWGVKAGERLGLVGPNGAGKTTQLKVLSGELLPTTGEVVKSSKDLRVAFLKQEFSDELVLERSLKDEFFSVFKEENEILDKLKQCEKDLEASTDDAQKMQEILNELGRLQEEAERKKVYSLDQRVDRVMDSMGFTPSDADLPVKSFSGGWKMRIGLGKVLLQEPNVLLLDEPTNHLDLDSVEWLEDFLKNQNLAMIIVSHDREFLDRVCTKIVDTDGGEAKAYNGNYSNFLKLKKAFLQSWQSSWENQQKKIQDDKDFINRFKGISTKAQQVQAREKNMKKLMEGEEAIKRPPLQGTALKFRFPSASRLSDEVAVIEKMTHGYGNAILFEDCDLLIEKGDRIAFVGPNGVGKSTLLRLVMGMEKPLSGRAQITGGNVIPNYFEQNQADALDLDATVEETIMREATTQSYNEIRALMAQFLFRGDSIQKKIRQLSGGEKARVALCKMMLQPANLLILDEPTNHLDIPAKEMLEEALQHYDGSILLISHDRYFVSQVATKVVAVEDKKLVEYMGDYKFYMERNEAMKAKIEGRYVDGVRPIEAAKVIDVNQITEKKNFGGKGGPSGRKEKGVKNAKRMTI